MSINLLKKYDLYFALACLCFILSGIIGYGQINAIVRLLIFPLLILYYFKNSAIRDKYLLCFIILFGFAELCSFFVANYETLNLAENKGIRHLITNTGNTSFLLGYTSIILFIVSKLSFKQLFIRFPVQILILVAVGTYLFFELNSIVLYREGFTIPTMEYYVINLVYNLAIVVLLGLSLLNYFYHDSSLTLNLLIACTALILSEFIQIASIFMKTHAFLAKVYIFLLATCYFTFFLFLKAKEEVKPIGENIKIT